MRHRFGVGVISRVCFNPRTRTGCDVIFDKSRIWHYPVSIHAPARGATYFTEPTFVGSDVSIHAPARGATGILPQLCVKTYCFNPRTRTGCDAFGLPLRILPVGFQSTHPHGVRRKLAVRIRLSTRFNPRTRTGCDSLPAFTYASGKFQSTHPHGVRLARREKGCEV